VAAPLEPATSTSRADELLDSLAGTGVATRPAGPDDAVDGVRPAVVASPADTAQTAAILRRAAELDLAVVARGTGSKLDWGLPPRRVDLVIDTTAMASVVEHVAGDLVVHAQAGVQLDALAATLAGSGQRLGLDPVSNPGHGSGTVGGVLATAADGPLRLSHGAPRDLVIGVTMVRADGVVAKAGGKVVKNVAGYDLAKLLTGSWGTLGVVTEAIFRLHPLPPARRWIVTAVADAAAAAERARSVTRSQSVPAAVDIDRPAGGDSSVAVLVEGVTAGVDARAAAIAELLGGAAVTDAPPGWWGVAPWPGDGTALRLTTTLTGMPALLATLAELPVPVAVRGSAGVGKLHAGLPAGADPHEVAGCVATLRERRAAWGGDVVVLRAPDAVRAAVDVWGPVAGLELMRRVKHEFDPDARLAPGRFVGGM
jgi:glycolate oxidase FAD binding subunit